MNISCWKLSPEKNCSYYEINHRFSMRKKIRWVKCMNYYTFSFIFYFSEKYWNVYSNQCANKWPKRREKKWQIISRVDIWVCCSSGCHLIETQNLVKTNIAFCLHRYLSVEWKNALHWKVTLFSLKIGSRRLDK